MATNYLERYLAGEYERVWPLVVYPPTRPLSGADSYEGEEGESLCCLCRICGKPSSAMVAFQG